MDKIKEFFKQIKWHEYLLLAVFYAVVICLGIIFHSSWLIILNTLVGIVYIFFVTKGFVIANLFGIIQVCLYSIISFSNEYYGEIVVCGMNFLICLITLILWCKNKANKDSINVKVGKPVSWKEWLLLFLLMGVIYAAFFFILRAFNTANLIVSTFSVAIGFVAGYLLARRSEFSFVFYIASNIISIILWAIVVWRGGLDYLPTLLAYCLFLLLNIFGIYNWLKMKRQQKVEGTKE